MTEPRHIERKDIEALLRKLDAHHKAFFAPTPESGPLRLYFIDSDVATTYVAGSLTRHDLLSWPNPLSITTDFGGDDIELSPDTHRVASATAQAISRFLFGEFNRQLSVQLQRYYLTPDHEREVHSVILALIQRAAKLPDEALKILSDQYLRLSSPDITSEDGAKAVNEIFAVFGEKSPFGQVARGNALIKNFSTPLSTHILRPPPDMGEAFLFFGNKVATSEWCATTSAKFFEIHLQLSLDRSPKQERYFVLKRKIFSSYKPNLAAAFYQRTVQKSDEFQHLGDTGTLEQLALTAVKECADVWSLARLAAVARDLNSSHAIRPREWEVCLITGSRRLSTLLEKISESEDTAELIHGVRIVHPLCYLRHAELYDPQGAQALEQPGRPKVTGDEYAIAFVLGQQNRGESSGVDVDDSRRFIKALAENLEGVVARLAEKDPSLSVLFRKHLLLENEFDPDTLQENLRNFIAHSFAEVFVSLRELSSVKRAALKEVSLPTLDLRKSNTALKIFAALRSFARVSWFRRLIPRGQEHQDTIITSGQFQKILKEDATGYSALLCAAVGYIARGRAWLQAADAVTGTAIMLAEGRPRKSLYPQGNEALFLKAFISRLAFDPRLRRRDREVGSVEGNLKIWSGEHQTLLDQAFARLEEWRIAEPESANESIFESEGQQRLTTSELIDVRYKVERYAGRLFAELWLVLLSDRSADYIQVCQSVIERLQPLLHAFCALLVHWCQLNGISSRNEAKPPAPNFRATYSAHSAFVGSQLWAATLQCWILLDFCSLQIEPTKAAEIGRRISNDEDAIAGYIDGYKLLMGENVGVVFHLTCETFAITKLHIERGSWGVTDANFAKFHYYSAIDEVRFPFFRERWQAAASELR